jgi:hypothetical protein
VTNNKGFYICPRRFSMAFLSPHTFPSTTQAFPSHYISGMFQDDNVTNIENDDGTVMVAVKCAKSHNRRRARRNSLTNMAEARKKKVWMMHIAGSHCVLRKTLCLQLVLLLLHQAHACFSPNYCVH